MKHILIKRQQASVPSQRASIRLGGRGGGGGGGGAGGGREEEEDVLRELRCFNGEADALMHSFS